MQGWHVLIGCGFGGKALEWLEGGSSIEEHLETGVLHASQTSSLAQDKWDARALLICACCLRMRDGGMPLQPCTTDLAFHPFSSSHTALPHLVQKSCSTSPRRPPDRPSLETLVSGHLPSPELRPNAVLEVCVSSCLFRYYFLWEKVLKGFGYAALAGLQGL